MTQLVRSFLASLFLFSTGPLYSLSDTNTLSPDASCVVLLHGLARTYRSMTKIEAALVQAGYRVVNIDYLSREQRIESLAHSAVPRGIEQCSQTGAKQIHFVTHSLGGILVRVYLTTKEVPWLGRVVMLAPPNQGSEVVDGWRDVPGFFWLNGPAGNQLGTGSDSVPRQLGPVTYPVGIIAGTRSINLILSRWLPNPDDGKVSVESTKVAGMTDFIMLPVAHPFIADSQQAINQVLSFLTTGGFDHSAAQPEETCNQSGELINCE